MKRCKLNTENLGNSKILNLLFKPAGILMGSRLRRWLMNPVKTLQSAEIQPGKQCLRWDVARVFLLFRPRR